MSMHKIPLTDLERQGLEAHNMVTDRPSQQSDAFRLGVLWALSNPNLKGPEPVKYDLDSAMAAHRASADLRDLKFRLMGTPDCPGCGKPKFKGQCGCLKGDVAITGGLPNGMPY